MSNYKLNKKRIYSNFNRINKWLGIIDYKTLWIIGIYSSIIIFILSKINIAMQIKLYIFAFFSLPVFAMFICSDVNQDSVFDMFKVIVKFILTKFIYVKEKNKYRKTNYAIYKKLISDR